MRQVHQHYPLQMPKPQKSTTDAAVDDETGEFMSDPSLTFGHPYPTTKIMFIPDKDCLHPDLLATTGDYLRIWQVKEDSVQLLKLLNNVRGLSMLPVLCKWAKHRI